MSGDGVETRELKQECRVRDAIVRAVCLRQHDKLPRLVRSAATLTPLKLTLRSSGLGILLRDRGFTSALDNRSRVLACMFVSKWKKRLDQELGTHGQDTISACYS